MQPLELHVYDFDGTLFRSPNAPSWWNHSWIVSEPSLGMPCVPDVPGTDWWISAVVAQARQSIANPGVYTILVTGRPAKAANFRYRVPELLKQAGLNFDEVHLNPGGETAIYKARTVAKVLRKFDFSVVQMWDDDNRNFATVGNLVDGDGLVFMPHPVHSTPHEIACGVDEVVEAIEEGWLSTSIIKHRMIQAPVRVAGHEPPAARVASRWLDLRR